MRRGGHLRIDGENRQRAVQIQFKLSNLRAIAVGLFLGE